MALDASLSAALNADSPLVFFAFELLLPAHTVRLLDGAGVLTFSGKTFNARDADFGVLAGVEGIDDSFEQAAPHYTFTLQPATQTGIDALMDPAAQGSAISCWFGAVDRSTGQVIGAPELVASAELDVCELALGLGERTVSIEAASPLERFFEDSEGERLNDRYLQSLYPGALGMEHLTDAANDPYWGANGPAPTL